MIRVSNQLHNSQKKVEQHQEVIQSLEKTRENQIKEAAEAAATVYAIKLSLRC